MNVFKLSRLILLLSGILLILIGLSFGGNPVTWIPAIYNTNEIYDVNTIAIYRSIMGITIGVSVFWLYCFFTNKYIVAALISLLFVMFGLAISRIISYFTDGEPSSILIVYFFLELGTGILAYFLIKENLKQIKAS